MTDSQPPSGPTPQPNPVPRARSRSRSESSSGSRSRSRGRSNRVDRYLRDFKFYRILKKDRLFAVVFLLLTLIVAAVGLAIPKIWQTAPGTSVSRSVRISAIDAIQAWSLARTARQAAAENRPEQALLAWRAATANNPGSPDNHRGILRSLLAVDGVRPENAPTASAAIRWLTNLTAGNPADLLLSAQVLDRHGAPDLALDHLSRLPAGSLDAADRLRARCLVLAERFAEFAEAWKSAPPAWSTDSILSLHADAWKMATDDRSEGLAASARLKQALTLTGHDGIVAARLLQVGALGRGQPEDLGLAIDRLDKLGAPSLAEHGRYWRLLAASGRVAEARAKAVAYRGSLDHPLAALRYLEALRALELPDEAIRFLDQNIANFGNNVEIWRLYYDLVADSGNWNELRRLAASTRILTTRAEALFAEALFADYRGAMGQQREREADSLRRELVTLDLADPVTAIRVASGLRIDGRAESAQALLRRCEKFLAGNSLFWNEVFATGFALKDITTLRRAVAEIVRLQPGSPVWKNNRAALLLITGENPSEALQLTLEGITLNPNSTALRINHAIALIQNNRAQEATAILERIPADKLAPDAASNYHLARAEALAATGRNTEAAAAAARIDRNRLLPQQLDRINRLLPAQEPAR